MSKGFTSSYRTALLAGLVFTLFGGLGARLFWLHILDRDELLHAVEESRRNIIVENARRGEILDSKGAILATSRPILVLGVDPQALRADDARKWPELSRLIGVSLADIQRVMTTKYYPLAATVGAPAAAAAPLRIISDADEETVLDEPDLRGNRPIRWAKLCDHLDETTYDAVKKLNVKGVYGTRAYQRAYPNNGLAAHVIGYVDHKERPIAGIEHYADFYLRGQNGWVESEKDGLSHEMAQFRTRRVPASDGYSVVLTIDATIQAMAEEEIVRIAEKYQPVKATIVISDPSNGFVLALANYPSFDLNEYSKLPRDEQGRMRNVAVADQYEPGSVFKIVAASAALNEGRVTPESTFDCTLEKIDYNGSVRNLPREDKSDHFDHPLSVAEIIAHSSNKGAAQLAMSVGDRRFYEYARAFGFGQRSGFPVGGEVSGTLRPPEKWDGLTITRMPMGQSIAATALQMTQAMEVIASGGVLLRPQVIREIRDPQGHVVCQFERSEVRRVISEPTARTMARLLMGVASSSGNGIEAAVPGYEVAGKTGTANKLLPVPTASGGSVLRYSDRHHVASFVGFFPASHPKVVISVIVDDADAHCIGGVAYGHSVAAPIFKRLAERLIPVPDLHIQPPLNPQLSKILALGGDHP